MHGTRNARHPVTRYASRENPLSPRRWPGVRLFSENAGQVSLVEARSATNRFGVAFSSTRCFRRRTSATPNTRRLSSSTGRASARTLLAVCRSTDHRWCAHPRNAPTSRETPYCRRPYRSKLLTSGLPEHGVKITFWIVQQLVRQSDRVAGSTIISPGVIVVAGKDAPLTRVGIY